MRVCGGYRRRMPHSLPGRLLVGVRLLLGTSSWATPKLVLTVLGLDPHANPHAIYSTRLFGVRDFVLGLGLMSSSGGARRVWWWLGMLCDLGDAAAGRLAARDGHVSSVRGRLLVAAGIAGAALGAAALAGHDD